MRSFKSEKKFSKLFIFLLMILTGCVSSPSMLLDDELPLKSFSEIQNSGYSDEDDLLITTILNRSRIDGKKSTYYGLKDRIENTSSTKNLFLVFEERETVEALKILQSGQVYFYVPTGLA